MPRPVPRLLPWRALQLSWGLPQALAGLAVLAATRTRPHQRFRTAIVVEWNSASGLSLAPFVFVPRRCPRPLLVHEYGHCVQSLLLGPLYLPLVGLPSLVWSRLPVLEHLRRRRRISYYAFFTERWANRLGERFCGEPAMGKPPACP